MPDPTELAHPVVHDEEEEQAQEHAERQPQEGIALCLSGGGYRAMLFHVGSLWRLNEAGLLPQLARISSVSGGSITAGALGMNWGQLAFNEHGVATEFGSAFVDPIREMASTTVDVGAVLGGILLPGSVSGRVTDKYADVLFGEKTLQDLPDDDSGPRFIFNATNLQSGVLWRFSKPYMADYKVGRVDYPTVPLATVVAASSAFPPVLSPVELHVDRDDFTRESRSWAFAELQKAGKAILSDGGVYDNLGLETAYKRYRTLLVSDGGGTLGAERKIPRDWGRHSVRVMLVIDSQVRKMRKRQLIGSYVRNDRDGTYWSIGSDIAGYGLNDPLPTDRKVMAEIAATPTRLKSMKDRTQKLLVNSGYVLCDTALRKWVRPDLPRPTAIPYEDTPLTG